MLFASIVTRPGISWTIGMLSRAMAYPTEALQADRAIVIAVWMALDEQQQDLHDSPSHPTMALKVSRAPEGIAAVGSAMPVFIA